MDYKKTVRFGNADAIIVNDLGIKNKIIDFLFSSINLSNHRYNILENIQKLNFLKNNEHYVAPNFVGYDYLLIFLTINNSKYCVAIDKKKLSYHKGNINIKKTYIIKLLVNASNAIFRGTIFDCKLIYTSNKYYMLIKDCFFLMGNKIIDIEMNQKMTHIDNIIKTQFNGNVI